MEFRVPLQAHDEARALVADGLDDIVALRIRFHRDVASQILDRLMVDGIDQRLTRLREHAGQRRAFREDDGMAVAVVQIVDVRSGAFHVRGDVLVQGAAEAHINQLTTAANAQHGFARIDEFVQQFQLVQVARAVAAPFGPRGRLGIGLRRDIGAALQHQAVQVARIVAQGDVRRV
ncbi:hypothetical protein D3C81_1310380 [compost metagenome]